MGSANLSFVLAIILLCQFCCGLPTNKTEIANSTGHSILEEPSSGYIITAGGYGNGKLANSNVLNLTSGVWSALPDLPSPSYSLAMVANRGQVYAIGGIGSLDDTMIYLSTRRNKWITSSFVDGMPQISTAVSLNNSIYVLGTWLTDPFNQFKVHGCDAIWSTLPSALHDHKGSSSAVLNGNIYSCAGGVYSNLCEYYNPDTQTWTDLPPMTIKRRMPAVVALNGFLYVIGGADGNNERYDPTTSEWSFFNQSTITNPLYHTAVTDGKYIYVIGGAIGNTSTSTDTVEMYRPDLNIWKSMPNYPVAADGIGAVYVEDMPVN